MNPACVSAVKDTTKADPASSEWDEQSREIFHTRTPQLERSR